MRLRYINGDAREPVMTYGGLTLKYGDEIDSDELGGLLEKAIKSGNYIEVTDSPKKVNPRTITPKPQPTLWEKFKNWLPKRK